MPHLTQAQQNYGQQLAAVPFTGKYTNKDGASARAGWQGDWHGYNHGQPQSTGLLAGTTDHYTFPTAYSNPVAVITAVFISELTDSDNIWTKILLPWQKLNAMAIQFQSLIFNDGLLDQVPEEALAHTLTSEKRQFQINTSRKGIAMFFEDRFLNTPQGVIFFLQSMQQMINVVEETANFATALQLLEVRKLDNRGHLASPNSQIYDTIPADAFRRKIKEEASMFARFHNDNMGLATVLDNMSRVLQDRRASGGPVYNILPYGSLKFLMQAGNFYKSGIPSDNMPTPRDDTKVYDTARGKVLESRSFNTGGPQDERDPFFRVVTTGVFNAQTNKHTKDVPPDKYGNWMRSILAYDQNNDQFEELSLEDGCRLCGLFEWPNPANAKWMEEHAGRQTSDGHWKVPLTVLGKVYFNDIKTLYQLLEENGVLHQCIAQIAIADQQSGGGATKSIETLLGIVRSGSAAAGATDTDSKESTKYSNAVSGHHSTHVGNRHELKMSGIRTFSISQRAVDEVNRRNHTKQSLAEMAKSDRVAVKFAAWLSEHGANIVEPLEDTGTDVQCTLDDIAFIWFDVISKSDPATAGAILAAWQTFYVALVQTNSPNLGKFAKLSYTLDAAVRFPYEQNDNQPWVGDAEALDEGQWRNAMDQFLKTHSSSARTGNDHVYISGAASKAISKTLQKVLGKHPEEIGTFIYFAIKNNINPPIGFLWIRNAIRHRMGTAVTMIAGSNTGMNAYNDPDLQFGKDPNRKVDTATFTVYHAAAIVNPKNIVQAPNVMSAGYLGGGSLRPWLFTSEHMAALRGGDYDTADMFCLAVRANWEDKHFLLDVTGRFNPLLVSDAGTEEEHYTSAHVYRGMWHAGHPAHRTEEAYFNKQNPLLNTLVLRDTTIVFDYTGGARGAISKVIPGSSHWGESYSGCAEVRNGSSCFLVPSKLSSTNEMRLV